MGMVLAELGERISRAIKPISDPAVVVDQKVLKECLDEMTRALLRSDVQFKLARDIEYNVKNIVNLQVQNKHDILQQAIFSEFFKMLDSGNPPFIPEIGKPGVIMFVGLQGSGKTATCAKYAHFHSNKGWKPALVCADTASFDQLKQNATKAKIPFYGSRTESDPVKIAVEGVERFKKENCDLIIVDTGGCYKQEAQLFEEMRQASEATKPDLVIFVMDSSTGQAAFDQAQAFKQSVSVGAVILTKMDGHAKGVGALSAISAAKSPVIFIGTGENMDDFEVFDAKPFVGRLLGMGNRSGLMDKLHEDVLVEQPRDLRRRLYRQEFTPRIMYEQYKYTVEKDLIGQMISKTGLGCDRFKKEKEAMILKRVHMMDWMTNEELDDPEIMDESRIRRIAQESGHQVYEVTELMERCKSRAEQWQMDKKRKARAGASGLCSVIKKMCI